MGIGEWDLKTNTILPLLVSKRTDYIWNTVCTCIESSSKWDLRNFSPQRTNVHRSFLLDTWPQFSTCSCNSPYVKLLNKQFYWTKKGPPPGNWTTREEIVRYRPLFGVPWFKMPGYHIFWAVLKSVYLVHKLCYLEFFLKLSFSWAKTWNMKKWDFINFKNSKSRIMNLCKQLKNEKTQTSKLEVKYAYFQNYGHLNKQILFYITFY